MTNYKYRYDVINAQGHTEQYTGIFNTKEQADNWFNEHGKSIKKQGRKLVLIKCKTKFQPEESIED